MTNYTNLLNNLEHLKLDKMRSMLPEYLEKVKKEPPHIIDALLELTNEEIQYQTVRASDVLIRAAAFPFRKTLDDFDFDFQPSINKDEIYDLATLRFVEDKSNILFVGNSGVGKTHLAVALGIKATEHRYSVYFITCHALIMKLNKAQKENRLDKLLQHMCQYRILIIDEIGYLPVDKQGSNLFFQLINKRYGNKSTIITTNMPFSKWSDVFYDATLANAVLDRLLHYSNVIRITGNSYRIKDKIEEKDMRKKVGGNYE